MMKDNKGSFIKIYNKSKGEDLLKALINANVENMF